MMHRRVAGILLSICIFQAGIPVYAQDTCRFAGIPAADMPADTEQAPKEERQEPEEVPEPELSGSIDGTEGEPEVLDEAAQMQEDAAGTARSARVLTADTMIHGSIEWMRRGGDMVMDEKFLNSVSSTYTDWKAFCLGRLGISDNYDGFLSAADMYVRSQYAAHPKTGMSDDAFTATEFHRMALALLAAGGDPAHIGGQDLIADGTYNCMLGEPWKQGVNGAAWALVTLDSLGYETPADAPYGRETLISYLLAHEISGGGWAVDPDASTPGADLTGTVVAALSPYCAENEDARAAAGRALDFFRRKMNRPGNLEDCETTARAVLAFASMGMNPASVTSVSGKSLLDGLAGYYNEETGGFCHSSNAKASNDIATDQAVYSLIAYQRFLAGGLNLFDFRNPANTTQYVIRADGADYVAQPGADAEIVLAPGTSSIQILNLPIGSYDAAAVTVDGRTFYSSFRRADGSTPVTGTIPVTDGSSLAIQVTHRDGTGEAWRLSVQTSGDAKVRAVKNQITALPEADMLELSDEAAIQGAKEAYDALTDSEKQEVGNYGKLEQALERLQVLKQEEQENLVQKREALKKKIEALRSPARISDKAAISRCLLELEEQQDWDEKDVWKSKLEDRLEDIKKREAIVEALDKDIWEKISPLWVSQDDASTVKKLMTRYASLYKEEQQILGNKDSLMEAAGIIDSLEDAVIPAKVFTNIRTTKGKFTYKGKLDTGKAYTLTFDGSAVQGIRSVDARVRYPSKGNVENAAACVKFLEDGSMNGTAVFSAGLGIEDGPYNLYWYNKDKKTVQSAGTAQVKSKVLTMGVSRGGKYWLSKGTVRLSGQGQASSGTASLGNGTPNATVAAGITPTASAIRPSTAASPTPRPQASTLSANTSGKDTSFSQKTTVVKAENGIIKAADFEKIMGKDRNLKVKGTCGEDVSYTITFNGEDVTKAADFPCEIKAECENGTFMRQLGDRPLILCMEDMGEFPGRAMVTIKTDLEDDTYLLFAYDPEKMKAEYMKKAEVANGRVRFILSEGRDYFIAKRAKAGSLLDAVETQEAGIGVEGGMADTGKSMGIDIGRSLLAAVLGFGVGGVLTHFYRKKKGRDSE